jgi:hypothetical protein
MDVDEEQPKAKGQEGRRSSGKEGSLSRNEEVEEMDVDVLCWRMSQASLASPRGSRAVEARRAGAWGIVWDRRWRHRMRMRTSLIAG